MASQLSNKGDRFQVDLSGYSGSLILQVSLNYHDPGLYRGNAALLNSQTIPAIHLGCIYQAEDHSVAIINLSEKLHRSAYVYPYINIHKESAFFYNYTLGHIHFMRAEFITKVLFFIYLQERNIRSQPINASIFFKLSTGQQIELSLCNQQFLRPIYAAGMLNIDQGVITLVKEDQYLFDYQSASSAYGFKV